MDSPNTIQIDMSQIPEYVMREFYEMMDAQLTIFYADQKSADDYERWREQRYGKQEIT